MSNQVKPTKGKRLTNFKIHMTNKFGTGLSTRKAWNIEDLILNRMNKSERRNWFEIWSEDFSEEITRDEWIEKIN